MYKTCCKCGSEKSLDRFYKNNRTKDGLCSRCSKCLKEYAKQRYDNKIKNPDLIEKESIKKDGDHLANQRTKKAKSTG